MGGPNPAKSGIFGLTRQPEDAKCANPPWSITKQYLGELAEATTPQSTASGADQTDAGRPEPAAGGMGDRGAAEGSDRAAGGEGV